MKCDTVLDQLAALSRHLGDPVMDYVILGEGNSSARIDGGSFWVKASGAEMPTIETGGFVRMRFEPVLALLGAGDLTDREVQDRLGEAKADPAAVGRPSVETVLHALALQLDGVGFVGHTHPTAVNAILCSERAEEAIAGRLFPDEIVYCGPAPVYVPYTDPGVPLARAVGEAIARHLAEYGQAPKVVLMQNHGLIALGKTAAEVERITAMYVKVSRVIVGAHALGGPHFLSSEAVARIHTRPDEGYRRRTWDGA
ncbi:MAG TPA: class II aldolase/adducin family protein [Anaerolineae bacterium]|nr:class II aldolase/adducin family protein [Anaerolineae bacterium]